MSLSEEIKISNYFLEKLSFNFSFISSRYSVNYKNINGKLGRTILEKMEMLSKNDYEVLLLDRPGKSGIETLDPKKVYKEKMSIPSDFYSSGRSEKCSKRYAVIKGSGYRVIGKINQHSRIFYVLAIDTNFELYDHG